MKNIKEDVYGHIKRLSFIKKEINNYLKANKLSKNKIQILDVGCGTGLMITNQLAQAGYNILGIDTDKIAINYAKKNNFLKNCDYQNIHLEKINTKYDIIICSEVLEHLKKPGDLVKEISNKLKNKGMALITVPNGYGDFEIENFFWKITNMDKILKLYKKIKKIHNNKKGESFFNESPHIQKFKIKKIKKIFDKYNLEIIGISGSVPFSGRFSNLFFGKSKAFINFNLKLGKILPFFILSGWYFSFKKNE